MLGVRCYVDIFKLTSSAQSINKEVYGLLTTNWSQPETVAKNPTTPNDFQSNDPQTGKRHGYPQSARQPLMLVNNKKHGHLGQGWGKDWTHQGSVSHNKPPKTAFRNNHGQIWVSEMLPNHPVRMQPSLGPRHLTRHNKIRQTNPVTSNSDTWRISETEVSEHNTTVYHAETKPRSGH